MRMMISRKTGDKGTQIGGTRARNIARGLIEIYVANHIGWARNLFNGKDDPRFIATFPFLMKSFYRTSDYTFGINVLALISKANKYASVLGTDFEDELTILNTDYQAAVTAHGSQMSWVHTDIVTTQMAAEVLAEQLTNNMFLIALNNRKSKTAAQLYFNTNLLYPSKRKAKIKGHVAAHTEQEICEIEYSHGKFAYIFNTGPKPLTFGIKYKGQKVGETITLKSTEKSKKPFGFFYTVGTSFYVLNESDMQGTYRFNVVA